MSVPLSTLCDWLEGTLGSAASGDYPNAHNGLQVSNRGGVRKIAAAVDASHESIQAAISEKAQLLLVHHGLFWQPIHPLVGRRYELIASMIDADLALFSSHLPLDRHAEFGNNRLLADGLGFAGGTPFLEAMGAPIGLMFETDITREELAARLARLLGALPITIFHGPARVRRLGIVSGGAGSNLEEIAAFGIDTFMTGEGPHWTYSLAQQLSMNVMYGGHYLTETFGVKALGKALAEAHGLPYCFLDFPSGL